MAVFLSPVGGVAAQFFDNNGNPLSGGKLFSYSAGSTTPAVTYTSSVGTTAHTNPIILDAGGRVPGGEIWLTDGIIYKFVLQTSTNVLIATYDNIVGVNSNFVNFTAEQEIQTATAGQTVFNLTTMQYQPGTNSLTVYVDGVNQYGPGAQYAYFETDSDTVTFVSGLHVGASVKFTTAIQTTGNATDASVVTYTAPYNDAVTYTVEDKLAQTVSVQDFGAVGDGVADDTAAVQAAMVASNYVEFPPGEYNVDTTILLTHRHHVRFNAATVNYQGSGFCFDLFTDAGDLDFSESPVLESFQIVGNSNAEGGIRINSCFSPKILDYVSSGFSNGCALAFRNVTIGGNARWNEGYSVRGFTSNFNKGGIRMYVDDGTTSFAYGYIQGFISCEVGSSGNRTYGMSIETTQLYNTRLDVAINTSGYSDAVRVGTSTQPGVIYWCDLFIRGEEFNSNNYSFDLTYGDVLGCTGAIVLNMGTVNNPNGKQLQVYGTYQRTDYGYAPGNFNNGISGVVTPLVGNFRVEDFPGGKPEAGFGVVTGTNLMSSAVWFENLDGNGFGVFTVDADDEPDLTDPLLFVDREGKTKSKAFFSRYVEFTAAGNSTTTYVVDNTADLAAFGSFLITAHCNGVNTNLASTALMVYSDNSTDVISPVATLVSQDYDLGNLSIQTYANIAANTFSAGNGGKFQVVVTNANATNMTVKLTTTRIGV